MLNLINNCRIAFMLSLPVLILSLIDISGMVDLNFINDYLILRISLIIPVIFAFILYFRMLGHAIEKKSVVNFLLILLTFFYMWVYYVFIYNNNKTHTYEPSK